MYSWCAQHRCSFLKWRKQIVARVARGCSQFILYALLWNLAMDELFCIMYTTQLLQLKEDMTCSKGTHTVDPDSHHEEKLRVTSTTLTKMSKLEALVPLKLRGEEMQLSGKVKYLEVILVNPKLSWNLHPVKKTRKAGQSDLQINMEAETKHGEFTTQWLIIT